MLGLSLVPCLDTPTWSNQIEKQRRITKTTKNLRKTFFSEQAYNRNHTFLRTETKQREEKAAWCRMNILCQKRLNCLLVSELSVPIREHPPKIVPSKFRRTALLTFLNKSAHNDSRIPYNKALQKAHIPGRPSVSIQRLSSSKIQGTTTAVPGLKRLSRFYCCFPIAVDFRTPNSRVS